MDTKLDDSLGTLGALVDSLWNEYVTGKDREARAFAAWKYDHAKRAHNLLSLIADA